MREEDRRRTALVLGAGSEIGRATIKRFLDAEFDVLAYTSGSSPLGTGFDSGVTVVALDLRDLESVEHHVRDSVRLGEVDALVCLAAQVEPSSLASVTAKQLSDSVNVGALANYLFIGRIGPSMAKRGWGRIVIGSSIGVRFGGGADSFAYALSRHTAEFLPAVTREWAARNVLTNVVRIGVTDTAAHSAFTGRSFEQRVSLIPARRPADPSEIADYLFWHGSDSNTFVTGQVLAISGGE
jgi:3-oxoacyl-[acyl-carrier protein] reductase